MTTTVNHIITVMGSTSVGKSALTIRFIDDTFKSDYDPTIAKSKLVQYLDLYSFRSLKRSRS